jgi:serine protease AprX
VGVSDNVKKSLFIKVLGLVLAASLSAMTYSAFGAADLSPTLRAKLPKLSNSASAGVVIIAFKTQPGQGLTLANTTLLKSVGIVNAVTFQKLGMVGAVATAGQVRALANNSSVQSIWSNDKLMYYMNQARTVTGVDKVRSNLGWAPLNGGFRVSGSGDFSVMVIDTGIDATHADLPLGTKVIQNTQRTLSTTGEDTGIVVNGIPVAGFVPATSIENVPNNDNVGHGTHCAGIIGGLGTDSGGLYSGVAPGVKIVGSGGGAVIVVLSALGGWEYALEHADLYRIRVISNSYGPIGGGQYDPNDPFMVAAKKAHDDFNIVSVFAAGNDGPAKGTISPYAQAPWVIGVAAGTKEGMLAGFSSRGIPRDERLSNSDPTDDLAAPTITAPGTGRYFAGSLAEYGFTSDIVSVRASTNLTANGTANTGGVGPDPDEIPLSLLPYYTEISGTSMATPFVAGTVALMLDADPTLSADDVKQILQDTATRMPGYADHEVGAGFINAYAAVDKVFNRNKAYANFSNPTFNATFTNQRLPENEFTINYDPSAGGANSVNSHNFDVPAGMSVLDVWASVDDIAEAGFGNLVGIAVYDPQGHRYGSTSIPIPVIGTNIREAVVNNPVPGTWRVEVKGACGTADTCSAEATVCGATIGCSPQQAASPGPVDVKINQTKFILPSISDLSSSDPLYNQVIFALTNRLIDTYPDGTFRPSQTVTREDLARSLMVDTPTRQSLAASPKFADVSGDLERIAEAVTSSGSTLRDYGFSSTPIMTASGNTFNPTAAATRLDIAVAFVKALGHDAKAQALAGQPVTDLNGTPLTDNAQIPDALKGYVQIAINDGMFEAFPASVTQVSPGVFQAMPGPRFEPASTITRAQFAAKLGTFNTLFTTGG